MFPDLDRDVISDVVYQKEGRYVDADPLYKTPLLCWLSNARGRTDWLSSGLGWPWTHVSHCLPETIVTRQQAARVNRSRWARDSRGEGQSLRESRQQSSDGTRSEDETARHLALRPIIFSRLLYHVEKGALDGERNY